MVHTDAQLATEARLCRSNDAYTCDKAGHAMVNGMTGTRCKPDARRSVRHGGECGLRVRSSCFALRGRAPVMSHLRDKSRRRQSKKTSIVRRSERQVADRASRICWICRPPRAGHEDLLITERIVETSTAAAAVGSAPSELPACGRNAQVAFALCQVDGRPRRRAMYPSTSAPSWAGG